MSVPHDGRLSASVFREEYRQDYEEMYEVVAGFPVIYSVASGISSDGESVRVVDLESVVDGYIPVVDIDTVMKGLDYEHTLYSVCDGVVVQVYKNFLNLSFYGVKGRSTRQLNKML